MVEHSLIPLSSGNAHEHAVPAVPQNKDIKQVQQRKPGEEFRICSECGYEYGFHVSLINTTAHFGGPVKSTRELFRVVLVCPNCGERYDVGWKIPLSH